MCVPRSRTSHLAPLLGDDFGVNSTTLVVLEPLLLFFANQKTKLGVHTRQMRHCGLSKVSKQSISDNCAHGPKSQPPASSFYSAHSKRKLNWPSTHFTPRSTRRSARALTRDCRLARHLLGPRPCNSEMLRPSNRFHDRQRPPLYSAQAPDYASSEIPYGPFIPGVGTHAHTPALEVCSALSRSCRVSTNAGTPLLSEQNRDH